MCWVIRAYRDRHKNSCSHDSVSTCIKNIVIFMWYVQFQFTSYFWISECSMCDTLTFFNDSNLYGLQLSWHQGSTWPTRWNLSTTLLSDASYCAVEVLLHLTGLQAYFFKWHASSYTYITNSAVYMYMSSLMYTIQVILHQLYNYTCLNRHA